MVSNLTSLAKDTAIYGISSIVGRFLNWCLTPLHVYIFTNTVEYGKVSQLYGYVAIIMVLLTYGMETGFFRFINSQKEQEDRVYATSMISLATTSLLFILFSFLFITPLSNWMHYEESPSHLRMMFLTVAIDAFLTIPFAYLRYERRPIRFASLKLAFIFLNILFNIFFLVACPWLAKVAPGAVAWFYDAEFGIGYIFLSNMLSTVCVLLLMLPDIRKARWTFDGLLLRRMLMYSFPLLILGLSGVINQTVTQLTYPFLFSDVDMARSQMGIYGACLKITVIITMFIQAFRYAYEPFIFAKHREEGDCSVQRKAYADVMRFFILFALIVFVAVMFYMDIIQYLVSANYREGLSIVPVAMMGEIMFGVYFNLSIWYKLTDNTRFGAYFSVLGCFLQVLLNIFLVPLWGYIASAWATLLCNAILILISYFMGQKYYRILYDFRCIIKYCFVVGSVYMVGMWLSFINDYLLLFVRGVLLLFLLGYGAYQAFPDWFYRKMKI